MALITCPECAKKISDRALACPHCGLPMNSASESPHTQIAAAALASGEIRVRCPGKWSFRAGRERQEILTPAAIKFFPSETHRFSAKPETREEAASIADLAEVGPLKFLWIMLRPNGANLGDECVAAMRNFCQVEDVTLFGPEMTFTNDCLPSLATMLSLRDIKFLDGCQRINDEGIVQIATLKNLSQLELAGTSVSRSAIASLKKMLPQCEITKL